MLHKASKLAVWKNLKFSKRNPLGTLILWTFSGVFQELGASRKSQSAKQSVTYTNWSQGSGMAAFMWFDPWPTWLKGFSSRILTEEVGDVSVCCYPSSCHWGERILGVETTVSAGPLRFRLDYNLSHIIHCPLPATMCADCLLPGCSKPETKSSHFHTRMLQCTVNQQVWKWKHDPGSTTLQKVEVHTVCYFKIPSFSYFYTNILWNLEFPEKKGNYHCKI